jgi:hypothetical protein
MVNSTPTKFFFRGSFRALRASVVNVWEPVVNLWYPVTP